MRLRLTVLLATAALIIGPGFARVSTAAATAPAPLSCLTGVSFQAVNGRWIGVNTGAGNAVTANATSAGPLELFTICRYPVQPIGGLVYTLHSDTVNRYLTFGSGPYAVVAATSTVPIYYTLGCSELGNTVEFEYTLGGLGGYEVWFQTSLTNLAVEANSRTQPYEEYAQTWTATDDRLCSATGTPEF